MSFKIAEVATHDELIAALGPRRANGRAVALVGGADVLADGVGEQLNAMFDKLAAYLDQTETAIVDGGTDSGVMRLIGAARVARGASFRLIGVAPRGALERTTSTGAEIRLAHGHPEIILVPGSRFGDETDWLFGAADHLAGGAAPTIVVNGGRLTMEEARLRLDAGQLVIAVAGSGRAADELASDVDLRASGRLRVIPLGVDAAGLAAALEGRSEGGEEAT